MDRVTKRVCGRARIDRTMRIWPTFSIGHKQYPAKRKDRIRHMGSVPYVETKETIRMGDAGSIDSSGIQKRVIERSNP